MVSCLQEAPGAIHSVEGNGDAQHIGQYSRGLADVRALPQAPNFDHKLMRRHIKGLEAR